MRSIRVGIGGRSRVYLLILVFPTFCYATDNHFNQHIEINNSIVTCTLDVIDNEAILSAKIREVVSFEGHYRGYRMKFNPTFMNGKDVFSSTLIDYEVVKVTRNGDPERFDVITGKNGRKFIEIYTKDGEFLKQGEHLYEVWYKARNRILPGAKIQSFNYIVSDSVPILHLDLVVYLGPNLSLVNTELEPTNEFLVVRGDDSFVRVYSEDKAKALKATMFSINFKNNKKEHKGLASLDNKQNVLFIGSNCLRIDFVLAIIFAVISVGTFIWYLKRLSRS